MTGREFSEVDIDLLADYVGGALDGTSDETLVATLISDNAAWRDAHETLSVAMASVEAGLHALGAEQMTMPAEVVSRLDTALSAAIPKQPTASPAATASDRPRRLTVVPEPNSAVDGADGSGAGAQGSGSVPGRARRRMRRWATPVTVAAGVLALAGFGFQQWGAVSRSDSEDKATSAAAEPQTAPQNAPLIATADAAGAALAGASPLYGELATLPAGDPIRKSGLDYRPGSFSLLKESLPSPEKESAEPSPEKESVDADQRTAFDSLRRLGATTELMRCLDAIAREHGGTPLTVDSVDYARFEGSPAVIVRFTGDDGQWAWAAGPACGEPGAAADTRYRVKVV